MKIIKEEDLSVYIDERGKIVNLTPELDIKDVLYITGKKGAVRGNHYHKTDFHYCYVVSGQIRYESQSADGNKDVVLEAGDTVFSPALEKHRFTFLTDGAFISLAKNNRATEKYEEDTVREEF